MGRWSVKAVVALLALVMLIAGCADADNPVDATSGASQSEFPEGTVHYNLNPNGWETIVLRLGTEPQF